MTIKACLAPVNQLQQTLGALDAGGYKIKLAENRQEIDRALALRYEVFVRELKGQLVEAEGYDHDAFDDICDHLLLIDQNADKVIGTYRLLRSSVAKEFGRFYSQAEFDIAPLLRYQGETLELGRACVDAAYRNRSAMQLLWRGIANYVLYYNIAVMFGCASFPGSDAKLHAQSLSYLYAYHLAPEDLRARALPERYISMDMVQADEKNKSRVAGLLPTLVKGYLKLGGFVGDGAVQDEEYNTTDIFIVVKTDLVTERYVQRYAPSKLGNA